MKIIIISHVPMSTKFNMGKTFISLFSSFQKSELCQLYIYPTIPDVDTCSSFYRITDKDVLKSYYRMRVQGGEVVANENIHNMYEHEKDEKFYSALILNATAPSFLFYQGKNSDPRSLSIASV